MWQHVFNYLGLKHLVTKVKSVEILITSVNNHSEYKYLDYLNFFHLRLFNIGFLTMLQFNESCEHYPIVL